MLQKRSTAWILLAVSLVLFVIIGLNLSVAREAKKVEDGFSGGVKDAAAGYLRPGIEAQLSTRIDASLGLITCCCDEPSLHSQVSALRQAREELIAASSVEEKYAANNALEKAWAELAIAMDDQGIDMTGDALNDYFSTMVGTQNVIEESGYNASVSAFYRTVLGAPPAKLLRPLIFVELPQYFGAEG